MFNNSKIATNILFTSAFGLIFLNFILIDTKPSFATQQSSTNCIKSVPDTYPFVGVLTFGVLGASYLLKQKFKNKGNSLDNNLLPINDFSANNNYQKQHEQDNFNASQSFQLQVIDPTEVI